MQRKRSDESSRVNNAEVRQVTREASRVPASPFLIDCILDSKFNAEDYSLLRVNNRGMWLLKDRSSKITIVRRSTFDYINDHNLYLQSVTEQ